ncbi:MAG: DNA methyltransferase [Candidatus Zixiibacteriota bacterium]
MKTSHRIIFGDSRSMSLVGDKSVHLIVTSPPYWQLKDYGAKEQIGFDDSYEDYINNLNLVWLECHRVLHDGCRLCINIGDQFARSVYYGRYKVIPIRTEITRFCETVGFDFMGSIIWQKVTTCNTTGGATIMGSFPYPRNGIVKIDYEFILLFKKHGTAPKPTLEARRRSKLTTEEWNQYFNGHWNFAGEKQSEHMAMFPTELPRRLIRMFSFAGETVLDPFLGSGTTSLAAMRLGRQSIGYEINKEFEKPIRSKLRSDSDLFTMGNVVFEEDIRRVPTEAFRKLPYLFVDPLKLDKKVDPKKLTFGSKLDRNTPVRSDLYSVEEIISPNLIRLENDLITRLLGVAPLKDKEQEAVSFLSKKLKGQKVSLKFDELKHDGDNHLMVYMFLKNKTFLNAHLIRYGLATLDKSTPISNKVLLKLGG